MVGPDTLARMKSTHVRADRRRHGSLCSGPSADRSRAAINWMLALTGVALVLFSSGLARHWIAELAATVCVLGGFIAAPILTIMAWIGLMAPSLMLLHRASTPLFLVAVVWLALALIGAHIHHSREQAGRERAQS